MTGLWNWHEKMIVTDLYSFNKPRHNRALCIRHRQVSLHHLFINQYQRSGVFAIAGTMVFIPDQCNCCFSSSLPSSLLQFV
jgi:hypothetical protein